MKCRPTWEDDSFYTDLKKQKENEKKQKIQQAKDQCRKCKNFYIKWGIISSCKQKYSDGKSRTNQHPWTLDPTENCVNYREK
jgi:hypothetical protein